MDYYTTVEEYKAYFEIDDGTDLDFDYNREEVKAVARLKKYACPNFPTYQAFTELEEEVQTLLKYAIYEQVSYQTDNSEIYDAAGAITTAKMHNFSYSVDRSKLLAEDYTAEQSRYYLGLTGGCSWAINGLFYPHYFGCGSEDV